MEQNLENKIRIILILILKDIGEFFIWSLKWLSTQKKSETF